MNLLQSIRNGYLSFKNEMLLKDFIINADYGKFMNKVSEKSAVETTLLEMLVGA